MDDRRKLWILVLCCIGQFMVILDVSVVNVALPSIRADLHFSGSNLQWVVNAYTLTFAGFLLLGGRAADLLDKRHVFTAGLALFGVASLVGGFAQSEMTLIIARGIQGLGGAIVAPATLSIISSVFTVGHERNRALGAWGAMGGVGGAVGVLLGGLLTEAFSWRWILFINVPIAIVTVVGAQRFVPQGRPEESVRRNFDVAGAVTATAGLVVLVYGIVKTESYGWGSARTLITLAIGLALLGVFVAIEGRFAKAPLMPLRVFKNRQLTAANIVVFMLGASMLAMWFLVSLYLQEVLEFSPIQAGLAFAPMASFLAVCSRFAGKLAARVGPARLLGGGMTAVAVGMLLFARMPADGSYWKDVLPAGLLCSGGIGFAFVPVTIAAMAGVEPREAGLASGIVNTARQVGGSLGLAILSTIAIDRAASLAGQTSVHAALTSGFHRAFVIGAGFAAIGALATMLMNKRVRPPSPVPAEA
jgi:EmrB/QacA subfamily drug resistance transporter